jgi:hypothetical protein
MTDVPLPPKDTALLPNREAPYNPNDWPLNGPSQTIDPQIDWQPVDITLLPGVPGQRGPVGPPGPKGDAGGYMIFTQSTPSTTWVIAHYLGYNPNVTVVDSLGNDCIGHVTYTNNSGLTITFNQPVSGTANLS